MYDVRVIDTMAETYQLITSSAAGAAAEGAAESKEITYQSLAYTHHFIRPTLDFETSYEKSRLTDHCV